MGFSGISQESLAEANALVEETQVTLADSWRRVGILPQFFHLLEEFTKMTAECISAGAQAMVRGPLSVTLRMLRVSPSWCMYLTHNKNSLGVWEMLVWTSPSPLHNALLVGLLVGIHKKPYEGQRGGASIPESRRWGQIIFSTETHLSIPRFKFTAYMYKPMSMY